VEVICKCCAILYNRLEHSQILVSSRDPGTNSLQILRDDSMYLGNYSTGLIALI
jgi:hypothetical protein